MDWRHQPATHGVRPVFDPALYDDGGGPAPQLQGNGTGAWDETNPLEYYELLQNGNIDQASPGLSLIDSYYSPHANQVQPTTIHNNLIFGPCPGFQFLPNDNSFAAQAPYEPLYHHPNHYVLPTEEPLSMDLHHGADLAWPTASSNGPSARQGNHWERLPSSYSFHGDSNHLEAFNLGGSQGAVTSVHPNPRYTLDSLVSVPGYYGNGALSSTSPTSFVTYQNGQTHNLLNHTPALFEIEVNRSPNVAALSQCHVLVSDRGETEQATVSRLNNYTSSPPIAVSQVHRPVERPFNDGTSTHMTNHPTPINESSYCSTSSRSEVRQSRPIPKVSARKRKKSSIAITSNSKTDSQCHVRPLSQQQIGQVPDCLRPWFHNVARCDPIPPELYHDMFKMVDGKEFCAIHGCTFETTFSRRRPGLKYQHANRHINHKPYYCLSCYKGYGRKEDHGLHPVVLASSLSKNPYLCIPSPLTTHTTDSETSHTVLA